MNVFFVSQLQTTILCDKNCRFLSTTLTAFFRVMYIHTFYLFIFSLLPTTYTAVRYNFLARVVDGKLFTVFFFSSFSFLKRAAKYTYICFFVQQLQNYSPFITKRSVVVRSSFD